MVLCAPMRFSRAALVALAAGCATTRSPVAPLPRPTGTLARPPADSLRITVVYPAATDVIQSYDSAFLFGSVGTGRATLSIDGRPVPVLDNGAWIAWVSLPDDTLASFALVAAAGADSQSLTFSARVAPRFRPPADRAAWIDTSSFAPRGLVEMPLGEGIRLAVHAAPGSTVRLRLASGTVIRLVPDTLPAEPDWGVRAFGRDSLTYRLPPRADRFVGWLPAEQLDSSATLEAATPADTARVTWPLVVRPVDMTRPVVVVLNDDTAHLGQSDSLTVGKAVPSGTYNWFFPLGTTAVYGGRINDQVRLQLSRRTVAWVNAADVVPLEPGTPPPGGVVRSVRLVAGAKSVTLRVPLPAKVPFQVEEEERRLTLRLYGVASDVNWMQYGGTDPLVARMSYAQPVADEVTITLELASPVWGYRARWDGRDLLLEVRRPPVIDPRRPLAGRTIVLDPGHPPIGARGPTGLWEPDATLAVAFKAKTLLERAGAVVLLTRADSAPVDLFPRTRFAEQHDADVLVSIHANALPDGVNPFLNNGTSVYYFHPRSAPLARALDRSLVAELGVRDLGFGRGDYALARNPWMPSALTEGLFMMLPEQERMLRSDDGQWRYARGLVAGIEAFLRDAATR